MKRLNVLFILLALIVMPAFSQKKEIGKVQTVVIDPGHGGDKPGALGKHCKEKDLTLSIATKFGKLITDNYPDVNVVFTRTTDVDVALADRAHMANQAKADLFISIHINSHPTAAPRGVETYVMGLSHSKENMDVAKKENADILLESNYKENADYKGFDPNSPESYVMFALYQNAFIDRSLNFAKYIQDEYKGAIRTTNRGVKQAELFVLYKTTMPAVLTEVGFISNPDEEAYMMSDEGQGTIAVCLYNAFANYKAASEGSAKPAKPVIDLPGYGKNKPTKAQLAAAAKALADSLAADSLMRVEAMPEAELDEVSQAKESNVAQADATRDESANDTSQPSTQSVSNTVTYRVQFLSNETPLPEGDKAFKGVTGYQMYKQDGTYRYTMGDEATSKRALGIQNEMRKKGFKDAFVIAFYQGRRISIQEARELTEQ